MWRKFVISRDKRTALLEDLILELHPLAEPLLVLRVIRVGQIHSFRGNKAETHRYVDTSDKKGNMVITVEHGARVGG